MLRQPAPYLPSPCGCPAASSLQPLVAVVASDRTPTRGCVRLGACQQAQLPDTGQSITIKAADYAFEAPDQIEAGLVTITLENTGQESHHAQLVRLNDGVTLEQFQAAMQEGEAALLALETMPGGPSVLSPGKQGQVTLDLKQGQYVLLCFVPDFASGKPHMELGMVMPFSVR